MAGCQDDNVAVRKRRHSQSVPGFFASYLDVQGGEVAVEVFGVIDVRLPTDWTHHVSDVFVPYSDGKVLLKTTTAHRALTRRERLHLR